MKNDALLSNEAPSGHVWIETCSDRFAAILEAGRKNMPTLTILPSGKTIDTEPGSRLLDAIVAAGEKIISKCGGEAKCGECHVFIQEGRKSVSKMQRAENEKLDTIVGVGSKSRLACQTLFGNDNVTVELLGFGSGA
jgi:2Fe-2S ferredoxin